MRAKAMVTTCVVVTKATAMRTKAMVTKATAMRAKPRQW